MTVTTVSRFMEFSRAQWAALRSSTTTKPATTASHTIISINGSSMVVKFLVEI